LSPNSSYKMPIFFSINYYKGYPGSNSSTAEDTCPLFSWAIGWTKCHAFLNTDIHGILNNLRCPQKRYSLTNKYEFIFPCFVLYTIGYLAASLVLTFQVWRVTVASLLPLEGVACFRNAPRLLRKYFQFSRLFWPPSDSLTLAWLPWFTTTPWVLQIRYSQLWISIVWISKNDDSI